MKGMQTMRPLFVNIFVTGTIIVGLLSPTSMLGQIRNPETVEWNLADLLTKPHEGQTLAGAPKVIASPRGDAAHFNGSKDAIFIDANPLIGLTQFTIEVVLCPDSGGEFEQRFLHLGEVGGDRVLLELRLIRGSQWYLDAFIRSGRASQTLVDSTLTHPAGSWYRLAFVVDNGKTATYVDGKHELDGKIDFSPFTSGRTSIGVRLNQRSWFKGAISRIRITPRCLTPAEFIAP